MITLAWTAEVDFDGTVDDPGRYAVVVKVNGHEVARRFTLFPADVELVAVEAIADVLGAVRHSGSDT